MADPVSVLFVGLEPESLGLDPSGPGPTAATIQSGIDSSMTQLRDAGYAATWLGLPGEHDADGHLRASLQSTPFDCVVIGAGIRLLPQYTPLLETLVEVVHHESPTARIAFNTDPADSLDAVRRHFPSSTA